MSANRNLGEGTSPTNKEVATSNFTSSTPNNFEHTTPGSGETKEFKNTEDKDEHDDNASDVSLELRYDAPWMRSENVSTSTSAFKLRNPIPKSINSQSTVSQDNSLVKYAGDLLSSISIVRPPTQQVSSALPMRIEHLLNALPRPPSWPLPPSKADMKAFFEKPTGTYVHTLTNFLNALEKSSEGRTGLKDLTRIGAILRRLVQPKQKGCEPRRKPKKIKKIKKGKAKSEDELDEQAQLDLAMKMSLQRDNEEDSDDQAQLALAMKMSLEQAEENDEEEDLKLALKMSLEEKSEGSDPWLALEQSQLDRVLQDSALEMGFETQRRKKMEQQSARSKRYKKTVASSIAFPASLGNNAIPANSVSPLLNARKLQSRASNTLDLIQPGSVLPSMIGITSHAAPGTPSNPSNPLLSLIPFNRHGPFRFKKLPLEVKNMIFEFLFVVRPATYVLRSSRTLNQRRLHPHIPRGDTAIFLVDKETSEEARAVFYKRNIFTIGNALYDFQDRANLYGVEEFVELVPRQYRRMVQSLEMEITLPKGWLEKERSGSVRNIMEKDVQKTLLGLGKLLRKNFPSVMNVRIVFRDSEFRQGNLGDFEEGSANWIAVSRQKKLDALRGLVKLPALRNIRVAILGPADVKAVFLKVAREVVDGNDEAQEGPAEERVRGIVKNEDDDKLLMPNELMVGTEPELIRGIPVEQFGTMPGRSQGEEDATMLDAD
ncbi:hypothetical protein VTL71DRAFT_7452 [Oculimacula yallundae]|uniref:F-box domain-containing protein n=1 Tax=Oculimacula yallundae TaxID=86028 RepID=A0ABR4BU71_9HELO